jgi:hypothetical protein
MMNAVSACSGMIDAGDPTQPAVVQIPDPTLGAGWPPLPDPGMPDFPPIPDPNPDFCFDDGGCD